MRKVNFGKNFIPKFVATLIAALLLPCLFFLFTFSGQKSAYAATEPEQTYNITSADDFVAYSRAYAAGDRNPKDVLNISISSGNEISDARYISLGTQSRPFAGKLIISTGGIDTFRLYNCPLFDYVSAEMIVGGSGVVKIIRERAAETPAAGVLTQGALFANHVVGGASAASWNVSFLPYSGEGNSAADYGGVIGEIAANASVSVNYNNTSNLPVSGSGSTGLICGTLGAGATLSVSTGGSGSAISVSSTGGNAGGLVGTMDSGATLNFATANNSRVNSVNSGAGYAGGIVGSAVDPVITFGAGEYAVNGTVSGKTGAGGLF
ncbi:MAG: hypothetical protein J6Y43_03145, partial [Clostridia bacterium]|nr:hypothetical protein [Clostridia bacterium]